LNLIILLSIEPPGIFNFTVRPKLVSVKPLWDFSLTYLTSLSLINPKIEYEIKADCYTCTFSQFYSNIKCNDIIKIPKINNFHGGMIYGYNTWVKYPIFLISFFGAVRQIWKVSTIFILKKSIPSRDTWYNKERQTPSCGCDWDLKELTYFLLLHSV
jgi:hypothetical protein